MSDAPDHFIDAAEHVLALDGAFAVAETIEREGWYVQWLNHKGQICFEVADPTYNDLPPLEPTQLEALEALGLAKAEVNFQRMFAPGELDVNGLADLAVRAFTDVFETQDLEAIEIQCHDG